MGASLKEDLRKNIKAKFVDWNVDAKSKADLNIVSNLKECLTGFTNNWRLQYGELPIIGLYLPLQNEPNVLEVLEWNIGRPSFPFNKNNKLSVMEYCRFQGSREDVPSTGYFFKTDKPEFCIPDLVLVPGLAFDRSGYRLGQGKGYYDLYFAQHECLSIGLCYSWQLIKDVGAVAHDKAVQMIITEEENLKIMRSEFL